MIAMLTTSSCKRAASAGFVASALIACGRPAAPLNRKDGVSEAAEFSHAELHPHRVAGRVVFEDTLLSRPLRVSLLNDSTALVIDDVAPYFHLFDRRTGHTLATLGRRGEGPGEFLDVQGVVAIEGGRPRFWAYEVTRNLLTLVDPSHPAASGDSMISLGRVGTFVLLQATDSIVVVMAETDSSALQLFYLKVSTRAQAGTKPRSAWNRPVRSVGTPMRFVPPETDSTVPLPRQTRRVVAADTRMCYEATVKKYVRINRAAGRVEYLDTLGSLVTSAQVPFLFDPHFSPDPLGTVSLEPANERQRTGYLDCTTTPDLVLALYSGRLRSAVPREQRSELFQSRFVHVFDWEGRLTGVLELDAHVRSMTFDRASGLIYAIAFDPEPSVMVFDVRTILGGLQRR